MTGEAYSGASGEDRSYTYNLNGAVVEAVDASGKTIYAYDSMGRITTETKKDLAGNTLSVVTNTQYDKAGNRLNVSYPGGKTVTFTYNKRNLLDTVTDGSAVTTYGYDANGNRTSLTLPNGVVTTTAFDAANRVTQLANSASGTNIYTTDYYMDKVGNRLKITETRPSGTRTLLYSYDNVYRMLSEADDIGTGNPSVVTLYTYDDAGNRISKTAGSTVYSYTVDKLNRVTSSSIDDGTGNPPVVTQYSYDANGNRTAKNNGTVSHTYSYDRENRLTSVSDGSGTIFSAVYDYRTRRISKVENGSTTRYIYDGGVNVEEYSIDAQNQSSLTKVLVRGTGMGGGIGSVLYTEDSTGSNRSFFCYNAIGSTVALTDSTGTVTDTSDYEAFGKVVSSTGSSTENRKFCTKERDSSTGLDNFGFRYFDWELGRFITRDPSGYPDGPNNYLYCHNNPINFIDPLGLKSKINIWDSFKDMFNVKENMKKSAKPITDAYKDGVKRTTKRLETQMDGGRSFTGATISTGAAVVGDILGYTKLMEGLSRTDLETGNKLSGIEAISRTLTGVGQLLLTGVALKGSVGKTKIQTKIKNIKKVKTPIKRTGPNGVDQNHHNANITVKDSGGNIVSHERVVSGNMTATEKSLGFPKNTLASHTEARAVTNTALQRGQSMTITGQKPPCPSCKGYMNRATTKSGASIKYQWRQDGSTKAWKATPKKK